MSFRTIITHINSNFKQCTRLSLIKNPILSHNPVKIIGRQSLESEIDVTSTQRQRRQFLSTEQSHTRLPVLTLYTKDPCPLCDEALEVLSPYLHQVVLEKVDITKPDNRLWWKEYRYEIPVFHLDGKFLMKHRADVDVLQHALKNITHGS